MLLAHLLGLHGIDSIVVESRSIEHVQSRVRAGVIEHGTAQLLRNAGLGHRMDAEGLVHDGVVLASDGEDFRIDFRDLVGKSVIVYGQTELTKDLYAARAAGHGVVFDSTEDVSLHDLSSDSPRVTFAVDGRHQEITARFVAGCDGYHGVSRNSIDANNLRTYELVYPFGWLGILSETPPIHDELIYANHVDGFALCSMRNPMLSRYYVQCSMDDRTEDWSDARFWDTLRERLPATAAARLVTGPSIEKSIAPLRSFVAEPLRHGSLFLAGDAAHIVPPTGAKGLNLALADVSLLAESMVAYFNRGADELIDSYSERALSRVWNAVRFSWWMTTLLHRFPEDAGTIRPNLQRAELDYLRHSEAARTSLAESYVG